MGDLCEALRLGKVLSDHNKQVQVARETTLGGHWDDVKLQQRHEITFGSSKRNRNRKRPVFHFKAE
jgi:hypothetical protein